MEHPRNLAAAPSTLLYQPRFDCRSGLLSGVHASLAGLDRGDGTFLDNLSGAGLMALREACDAGRPLVATNPESPAAQAFLDLARKLT